jgi:hypothetical protein
MRCESPSTLVADKKTADPSTARRDRSASLPRISCGTCWRRRTSCAFPKKKGAHATLSSAARQEIRVGMTKGREGFPFGSVARISGPKSETWGHPSVLSDAASDYCTVARVINSELSGCGRTTVRPVLMRRRPVNSVSGELPSSKCKW